MGRFLPVFSGVSKSDMPDPTPENVLFSVSACGESDAALNQIIKLTKSLENSKIFLDNGMFTLFQKWKNDQLGKTREIIIMNKNAPVFPKDIGMNNCSEIIAKYASAIKPDVTFCMDLAVPKLRQKKYAGEDEFNFRLSTYNNILSAYEMVALKPKYFPTTDLYFVFQGYHINHLLRIKQSLLTLNFDGWAIPTRVLSCETLAGIMLILYYYGIRKIHIFAGSNLNAMIVGVYFARHFFDEVSYDSTNWLKYAINHDYRLFGSMRGVNTGENQTEKDLEFNKTCYCPHCRGRSIDDIRAMTNNSEKIKLLKMHNYYIEVLTADAMADNIDTPNDLLRFLLNNQANENSVRKIFDCLNSIHIMKNKFDSLDVVVQFAKLICDEKYI
jgi:hypothetical protein